MNEVDRAELWYVHAPFHIHHINTCLHINPLHTQMDTYKKEATNVSYTFNIPCCLSKSTICGDGKTMIKIK